MRVIVERRKVAGAEDLFEHLVGWNTQLLLQLCNQIRARLNFDGTVIDFDGHEVRRRVVFVMAAMFMVAVMGVMLVAAIRFTVRMLLAVAFMVRQGAARLLAMVAVGVFARGLLRVVHGYL
ncbi:hypothetical protein [Paraburkholderia phenoliruptrix]|uniref:hypothetical protein n=1 Tax=Paraburkholderia phenoliruptrix TaxID=252970 RepID=UPI002869C7DC|nr:hypothetical protein [Paraburkholderia phenoliruptrix]WMY08085.1 hypothetical protein P3F88_17730 [Paraburkholderia phenoliruptrix]